MSVPEAARAFAASPQGRWWIAIIVTAVVVTAAVQLRPTPHPATFRYPNTGLTGDTCFGMVDDDTLVELLGAPADELFWGSRGRVSFRPDGRCPVANENFHEVSLEVRTLPNNEQLDWFRQTDDVVEVEVADHPEWEVLLHRHDRWIGAFLSAHRRIDGEMPPIPDVATVEVRLPDDRDEVADATALLEGLLDYYESWTPFVGTMPSTLWTAEHPMRDGIHLVVYGGVNAWRTACRGREPTSNSTMTWSRQRCGCTEPGARKRRSISPCVGSSERG